MRGKLFTEDYLDAPDGGITETSAWRELGEADLASFRDRLTQDLILAYMNAVASGDLESRLTV